MMNLKKIDPLTVGLILGLAAAIWYKRNGGEPTTEAYCSACRGR